MSRTRRLEFSNSVRAQAFARAGGACELKTAQVCDGPLEYDHRLPAFLGGASDLDNCVVACKRCHAMKTASQDLPIIAKVRRLERKHSGNIKPKVRRISSTRFYQSPHHGPAWPKYRKD